MNMEDFMDTTLIAYVTKTGSTREIALYVQEVLNEKGIETVVLPVSEVQALGNYSSVVVGAPINGMQWAPEAAAFVRDHRDDLRERPVALFAVSYMHAHARPMWKASIEKSVRTAAEAAGARTTAIFGGRIATPLPGAARLLFGLPRDLPLDTRDQEAIRAWAHSLPGALSLGK